MENFTAIGSQLATQFDDLQKAQSCVNTSCVTKSALLKETQSCVNTSCTIYEMIPKHEYGLLLRQLEEWGTAYPKSVCKIYGVKTVQRAVAYTKATPNVRNKGAYCMYMCRQLKKENQPQEPQCDLKPVNNVVPITTPKEEENEENYVPCPPEIKEKLRRMGIKVK